MDAGDLGAVAGHLDAPEAAGHSEPHVQPLQQHTGQAAIRAAYRAMVDHTGNPPSLPSIFPDQMAPVVRTGTNGRELVMMRWAFHRRRTCRATDR